MRANITACPGVDAPVEPGDTIGLSAAPGDTWQGWSRTSCGLVPALVPSLPPPHRSLAQPQVLLSFVSSSRTAVMVKYCLCQQG